MSCSLSSGSLYSPASSSSISSVSSVSSVSSEPVSDPADSSYVCSDSGSDSSGASGDAESEPRGNGAADMLTG